MDGSCRGSEKRSKHELVELGQRFGRLEYKNTEFNYLTKKKVNMLEKLDEHDTKYDHIFGAIILANMLVVALETDLRKPGKQGRIEGEGPVVVT